MSTPLSSREEDVESNKEVVRSFHTRERRSKCKAGHFEIGWTFHYIVLDDFTTQFLAVDISCSTRLADFDSNFEGEPLPELWFTRPLIKSTARGIGTPTTIFLSSTHAVHGQYVAVCPRA